MNFNSSMRKRTGFSKRVSIIAIITMLFSMIPFTPALAEAYTLTLTISPTHVTQTQDVTITVEATSTLDAPPSITIQKPDDTTISVEATQSEESTTTWIGLYEVDTSTVNGTYDVTVVASVESSNTTESSSFDVALSAIQGTVYDGTAESTPALANCEVQLFDQAQKSPPIDWKFTGGGGNKYRYRGIEPGTYWVEARRPTGTHSLANSIRTQVVVTEGATTTANLALRAPSLTGRVVDPDGNPASDVRVNAHNQNYSEFVEDSSDSEGRFVLPPASNDTYGVIAYPDPNSGYASSAPRVISLGATPQALSDGNPLVLREIIVRGQILPPGESTEGVSDVGVMIRKADWSYQENASTDDDGNFYFGAIPPGSYKLEAFASPDSGYSQATPVDVTITGDTQTLTSIRLTYPSIVGTVTDPDDSSTPSTNAFVQVHNSNWSVCMGSGVDQLGQYVIGGLPEGTYTVQAMPGPSSSYSSSVETSTVVSADSSQTVNLELTAPTIVGKIVASTDDTTTVRNANVVLHTEDWQNAYFSQPTQNNGRFSLGGIAAGTYFLEINPPWERPDLIRPDALTVEVSAENTYSVTDGDYTTTTVNGLPALQIAFTKATKTIEGTVTVESTTPVTNAQVFAFKDQGCGFARTTTDENGQYSLGVSSGKWNVCVEPNKESTQVVDWAYTGQPQRVTFAETSTPETETVNFQVSAASAIITGYILSPDETSPVQNVRVEARNNTGRGNGANSDSEGAFTINVPAGTYQLMTCMPPSSPYGSPAPQNVVAEDGTTTPVGNLILTSKNSQVNGYVRDGSGQGVADVQVNAMQPRGGFTQTTTDDDGSFTLNVSPGSWEIMVCPSSDASYVYSGPQIRVSVGVNEIKNGVNFEVTYADSTIQGRVVDGNGDTMTDLYGFACASTETAGYGGPLQAGRFELNVPAGTYNIGGGFPPGTPYSLSPQNNLTIASGDTTMVALSVVENDKTISGTIFDDNDVTITADNLFVEIFAMNGTGSFQHAVAEQNEDGAWEYSLPVTDGDWRIGYFVDKSSGYIGRPPMGDDSIVTVEETETTHDITLYSASSVITGQVTDPDGDPLACAFVFAQEPNGNDNTGRSRFFTDTMTDSDGNYTLNIPAGSYEVGSGMPPSKMKSDAFTYPTLQAVTVAANDTETLDIAYGSADSNIQGTVTLDDTGVAALVWAWSDDGSYAEADANDSGAYTIPVKGDETWHVGARYENDDGFYTVDENEVAVSESTTETVDLTLATVAGVPNAVTITFDANEMKNIELSNGTIIQISAGALASSGNVTVMAKPIAGLRKQKDAQPVGLGYDLSAMDENGQTISNFSSAVTITIPYNPNDLPEGISEDDLVPAYWDETSGTWQKVDSAVVDTTNNTISIQVTHFSIWGSIARAASTSDDQQDDNNNPGGGSSSSDSISSPSSLKATAVPSAKAIELTWNANTDTKLSGYYLYRSLTNKVADATKIATIAKGTTKYSDTAITDGTTYYYWLSAYDTNSKESSKYGPMSATAGKVEVSFSDLIDTHWAKQYIAALVAKGIISGYSDQSFRPEKTVTRAEFAKMVCLAKGWQLSSPATVSFNDVSKTDWSYTYIETAKANGAIGGYQDGSFKPGSQITRAEIAKIMATAQGLTSGSSGLIDIDGSWAKSYINACVQAGIVGGYSNGTFKPSASATRAEAAKMIYAIVK